MAKEKISRRQFARRVGAAVGAAVGATLAAPELLDSLAEARRPKDAPENVIQLNSNENPYGPSTRAQDAIKRSPRVAARYPDAKEVHLIDELAKLHGVQPENIVLGCGSGEILQIADMAFLAPGKTVVVAEPTFEAVLAYARVTRAEAVKVPLTKDFRHDLPAMAAACDARTGLVYVCNPNNPTATIVTREELAAFLERVPETATVLLDEAYHHFVEDPNYASGFEFLSKTPNLVVVRTFSKIYGMAGMRLGYAVAAREKIAAMREHVVWNNSNASVLEAALASLEDRGHVPRQRQMMNDTRRFVMRELEREGRRTIPSETNFFMVDVGGDVQPVIAAFRQRNILVGRRFPSLPTWLRVSVGTRKEMEKFLAALREIVPVKPA
jgi:histidinol-phosphate aminotransferase